MLSAPLASALDVTRQTAELYRPPRRLRPSEAAARFMSNEKGQWSPDLAPMMVEPLDLLASREYQGIVFVGPARTGKTFGLILAGVCYVVTCAPGDMLIIQMSQDTARDFSRTDLDRVLRHSSELAKRLSPRARDDNTYDKFFRSGIALKIGWPAVSQLSSKTLQYVMLTDYDRPENRDDVDGEGPMWDLASKRIETYMSRGKCLAESSPGEDYLDPKWKPQTQHEAPPARGILSLYNRGTRARWFWPCKHCGTYFQAEPGLGCFGLPDFEELSQLVQTSDLMSLAERYARVICTGCGGLHEPSDRPAMSARGRWVHEGESIDDKGVVTGTRRRTQIASFWLGGPAAPYQRWESMLLKYLQGVLTYVRTGDEAPLRTTTNTDQGAPYLPRSAAKRRTSDEMQKRLEDLPKGYVPEGVRFLTAAVDVQGNRFIVEVYGWGVGLERWVVDRFVISSSRRPEGDRFAALDPSSYIEDWLLLEDAVVRNAYKIVGVDGSLTPMITVCDSGGREGVTGQAYEFWRRMSRKGLGQRFMLVKGVGQLNAPRVNMVWPDSKGRKDRGASHGDVPVWMLNVNVLKDGVAADLAREVPGAGYVHLPRWLDATYFDELTIESRNGKGIWERPQGARNEAFDLHVYNRAACVMLKAESIDWRNPPEWAAPFDKRRTANPSELKPKSTTRRQRSAGVR